MRQNWILAETGQSQMIALMQNTLRDNETSRQLNLKVEHRHQSEWQRSLYQQSAYSQSDSPRSKRRETLVHRARATGASNAGGVTRQPASSTSASEDHD